MVDRTSLIWNVSNIAVSFFVAWLTVPALYGMSVNVVKYFHITMHLYVRKYP